MEMSQTAHNSRRLKRLDIRDYIFIGRINRAANVRCNMANSGIIGAGQDTAHRAPKKYKTRKYPNPRIITSERDESAEAGDILIDVFAGTVHRLYERRDSNLCFQGHLFMRRLKNEN